MPTHRRPDGTEVSCTRETFGSCRICELIDPASPHYREGYRRLFFPGEFPAAAIPVVDPSPITRSPPPPPAPGPVPVPATGHVPLAGDLVAMATHRLGADRLARWVAAKIGVDCGCESRKIAMNRIDATLRRYLGLG